MVIRKIFTVLENEEFHDLLFIFSVASLAALIVYFFIMFGLRLGYEFFSMLCYIIAFLLALVCIVFLAMYSEV